MLRHKAPETDRNSHWNDFYKRKSVTNEPSGFAEFVQKLCVDHHHVIEFGCGNGRDATFFAECGMQVDAFDKSASAIKAAATLAAERGVDANCRFAELDVSDDQQLREKLSEVAKYHDNAMYYARFFMHSLDDMGEAILLGHIAKKMRGEDLFCIEFRTSRDQGIEKVFGEHYRRYIDPQVFGQRCLELGFKIKFMTAGYDLAPYGDENPHIARFVLVK